MHTIEDSRKLADWLWVNRRSLRPETSQKKMAEICGVAIATYARWEKGESIPDYLQVQKLEKIFGRKAP